MSGSIELQLPSRSKPAGEREIVLYHISRPRSGAEGYIDKSCIRRHVVVFYCTINRTTYNYVLYVFQAQSLPLCCRYDDFPSNLRVHSPYIIPWVRLPSVPSVSFPLPFPCTSPPHPLPGMNLCLTLGSAAPYHSLMNFYVQVKG